MKLLSTLLVVLSAGVCVGQQPHNKDCPKGQYLSMDGRCLKDHTGEARPAGDGCNTMTCTDPACRYGVSTAMACSHPDDPASSWGISSGVLSVPHAKQDEKPAQPAPLKCGKYEHVYSFCDEQKRMAPNTGPCFDDGPPRCVPDMHTVTEKEWQELMERLKKLEGSKSKQLPAGVCIDRKTGDLFDCQGELPQAGSKEGRGK